PYDLLLARDGIDPGKAVYFEDMAKNLLPAKEMGMTTVWVHTDLEWAQAGRDDPRIDHQTDDIVGFLRTLANGS
ncbi:MAG TPA: pyrimidine 5'-nucleotidase, partial [Thalassospira lucentensis]|nr:pyrimidine 5'-nucleotidase [Thalassospira lucentensis]